MNWKKIIAFKDNQKKEVGRIEASTENGVANFKIIGRIWSWSADEDSILRCEIDNALNAGIKNAVIEGSSQGGSVFATNDIVVLFEKFDDVKIKVGALMASAFTYLTSKFHTTIKSNTQGMIHMPRTAIKGNINEAQSDLKLLQNVTEDYAKAYSEKTGMTIDKIKELWKNGDYWMNAQELKDKGFVDAIEGEIEAFSATDITALVACGAPVIPEQEQKQQIENKMDREKLIALYGLEANASDEQIMEAARKAKVDAEKHHNAEKEAKQKQDSEKETEVAAFVDGLIKDKKATAEKRESLIKLGNADLDSLKAMYKDAVSVPQLSKEINPQSAEVTADRKDWTLDDYLEKDPEAYEKMKSENPEKAASLEKDYFGNQ